MSEGITKLTLDTLLERINALGEEMRAGFTGVNARLDRIEQRLDATEIRLEPVETLSDRVAGAAYDARADIVRFGIA